jgi:hypothetical protein
MGLDAVASSRTRGLCRRTAAGTGLFLCLMPPAVAFTAQDSQQTAGYTASIDAWIG